MPANSLNTAPFILKLKKHASRVKTASFFKSTDSGIGMTEEQVAKIFDAFTQGDLSTTRKYGGTGLGLAITRQICHLLGGDIYVTSQAGRGSTFRMVLPASWVPPNLPEEQRDSPPLNKPSRSQTYSCLKFFWSKIMN